ncbi:MAG TPA: hypothetical protein VMT61_08540 [Candidatus Binataceae bacterium]|nr:hypothetical protein [Candidatus Binataceae bacterium]
MKHLSSRWAVAVLLVPVALVLSILMAGWVDPPLASSSNGKGYVQVAFTGAISGENLANPFPNFQSVLLNVIAVRFNPTTNMSLADNDSSWATVTVAPGATNGAAYTTFSFGGNFGPNGNSIGIGQARSVMQLDMAQLQNNLTVFNTAKIKAQDYYQVELLLNNPPATLVPLCGNTTNANGEGCITYPTSLSGVSSIRYPAFGSPTANTSDKLYSIGRSGVQLVPIAINAIPLGAPISSTDTLPFSAEICPIKALPNSNPIPGVCVFSPGLVPVAPPSNSTEVAAVVSGQIFGSTNKGQVNAEISGTGTVLSTGIVDNSSDHNYFMMVPAGTYDLVASSGGSRSFDAQSHVVLDRKRGDQYVINFHLEQEATRGIGGIVADACNGTGISGAEVEIYGPPSAVDNIPCSPSPTSVATPTPPPQCNAQCDQFAPSGAPQDGCVVLGISSTNNLGQYPFSPSGGAPTAFSALPHIKSSKSGGPSGYAMKATASGYNGRLLGVRNLNSTFKCDGSGYKDNDCSFSLQHGTLQVNVDAGQKVQNNPLNVLVNVEDQGSFNGEGVALTSIPVGQQSNPAPLPITVPLYEPSPVASPTGGAEVFEPDASATKATPTPTGTPVDIGGAANYDMFASVQDLFGPAPQKVGGHTYAVLSGAPAPQACATTVVSGSLTPLKCVGHGSVQGTVATVDQNTILSVSKGNVAISQSQVAALSAPQNFSICEPADDYVVSHYQAQPTGTPEFIASADANLVSPATIPNYPPKAACFSICDVSSSSTPIATPSASPTASPKGFCYLCQNSTPIPGTL